MFFGLCFPLCWPYLPSRPFAAYKPNGKSLFFPNSTGERKPTKDFYKPCVDHMFILEPAFTTEELQRSDQPVLGRVTSGAKG